MVLAACLLAGASLPAHAKEIGFAGDPITLDLIASTVSGDWSVDLFAQEVEERSKGELEIRFLEPVDERDVVGVVQSGTADIGQVFARGLDGLDAPGIEVLLAPFVVDDIGLLKEIAAGPIGADILADLRAHDLEGLAIAPGDRRFPVGLGSPVLTLADFEGARISIPPTSSNQALARALGGEPADVPANDRAALDAAGVHVLVTLARFAAWPDAYVTANLPVHAMPAIWMANAATMAELSEEHRAILTDAGAAVRDAVAGSLPDVDPSLPACLNGATIVMADPADVAAIVDAAQPVVAGLAEDAATASYLDRIAALKVERGPGPVLDTCEGPGQVAAAGIPDGAYTTVLTRQRAFELGVPDECAIADAGRTQTLAFKGDEWTELQGCGDSPREVGSYGTLRYDGDRLFLKESFASEEVVFRWTLDGDQLTLELLEGPAGAPPGDVAIGRFLFENTFTREATAS
jgi:TRAP-type C4-dicarboxylate transport system substrate-binding protein